MRPKQQHKGRTLKLSVGDWERLDGIAASHGMGWHKMVRMVAKGRLVVRADAAGDSGAVRAGVKTNQRPGPVRPVAAVADKPGISVVADGRVAAVSPQVGRLGNRPAGNFLR